SSFLCGIGDGGRGFDAIADHIAGEALHGICGIAVVSDQATRPGGDRVTRGRDQRVHMGAAGTEGRSRRWACAASRPPMMLPMCRRNASKAMDHRPFMATVPQRRRWCGVPAAMAILASRSLIAVAS